MKQLFARYGGVTIVAMALAACSGNQGLTPPAALTQDTQPAVASLARATGPQAVRITPADISFARTFQFGKPHLASTRLHDLYPKGSGRPASPGYPMDMACAVYGGTCTTMPSSTAYDVYVSPDGKHCMDESCWGTPEEFLKGLAGTKFAGLVTQYTHGKASGYTYGDSIAVPYTSLAYSNVFYDNDLGTILAAAVKHFGKAGNTVEYHIFLPPGYDTCEDETTSCYSPDNLPAFAFCAYHSSAYIPALATNVIYSIEPWAGATVKGGNGKKYYPCGNSSPSVAPSAANFQASLLAHESFESWSDPLFPAPSYDPLGYVNYYGMEIGDVCAYRFFTTLKTKKFSYNVQDMYSNAAHACNNS
jgi:hypothetical protein